MKFITLSDYLIRTTLRDYRIKYGKDPSLITINKKTNKHLKKIYLKSDYCGETYLYGVNVLTTRQNDDMLFYNEVI